MQTLSFGEWLTRRRKSLDLTRSALARRVPCSVSTLRRLEADDLRASTSLAAALAQALELPKTQQTDFVAFARGERAQLPEEKTVIPQKTTDSLLHLPAALTGLIGRQREVGAVAEALRKSGVRLLTLSGPPGAGKTRLSLAVAEKVAPAFHDGVYFVALASVANPEFVPAAIAQTLGLNEKSAGLTTALIEFLRKKRLLLVLDNFEHLIPAASLVNELLAGASGLKVLVTSREILHLYGEHEFPVPPLEVLDVQRLPTTQTLDFYARNASIQFFRDRARAADPSFHLTRDNAADVARICAWLDGLPLAIEIAAAQVKWHPPAQLFAQLQDRLAALTGGPRDRTPRQQSLRGAMDWSFDLLDETEKRLFCLLGIFSGGCTEEEALEGGVLILEPATRDQAAALKVKLHTLTEKSLLQHEITADGPSRYSMLETMRDYALDQLILRGELERTRNWHAEYFLKFAQRARPHMMQGSDQTVWQKQVKSEYSNLRAALTWAVISQPCPALAVELAYAIHPFWLTQSMFGEARYWLGQILAFDLEPSKTVANLCRFASDYASTQADYVTARSMEERAISISTTLGDEEGIYFSLDGLATLAGRQGEYARAVELLEQVASYRRVEKHPVRLCSTLNNLALALRRTGNLEPARQTYQEVITFSLSVENLRARATALNGLAEIHQVEGDNAVAIGHLRECLSLRYKLENLSGIAVALECLAVSVSQLGAEELAVKFQSIYIKLRDETGMITTHVAHEESENFIAHLRARVGDEVFEKNWAIGQTLTLEQIMELALDSSNTSQN